MLEELFREKLRDTRNFDTWSTDSLVAFEEGFVWAIEYEERMDVETDEAKEAIVKSAKGWIGASFSRLDLEEPDADVNCQSEGPVVCNVQFRG